MANITQKITPFLWFNNNAQEAAAFYTSIFPNSSITSISYYGDNAPLPKGSVMIVGFKLEGLSFTAMNGGPGHDFTDAISLVVHCRNQEEVDHFWSKLTEDGKEVACGWLKDKYGLSWQITPDRLIELISDPDKEKANRVFQAMMKMIKIDIPALEKAAENKL